MQLARSLRPADTLALEVSTSANAVCALLQQHSPARIFLSNPMQTKLIAANKAKTDKIDARILAELVRVEYLPTVWIPDRDTLQLRHLATDQYRCILA